MSLPPLCSLSNELLIEIISNLGPVDIYACRCTCRRLNSVIINSHLIQYIFRTALSGVFDPLEPGLSLPDRLDALERWETAWMEMDLREPNAIVALPVSAENPPMPGRVYLSGQYVILCHAEAGVASPFYYFLDIHAMSSHTNATRWTTIEIDAPALSFTFASELDLTVAIPAATFIDYSKKAVTIRPLQFSTGKPHPSASQPELEVSVSGSAADNLSHTTVIGDYILYCVGAHDTGNGVLGSLCGIYLVAWREGWVSELCTTFSGIYSSRSLVLSEEIILLVRLREPALELCRLLNIDHRENASLERVRILSLPSLTARTSLGWAHCFGEHPGHVLFSKNHQQHSSLHPHPRLSSGSGLSTEQPEGRIDMRRHLHSVPADGIIVIVMYLGQSSGIPRVFDLTVRCRTLLEFSNSQAQASAAGTGTGTGMGTVFAVPWERWGPNKAHILEYDGVTCGGSLAGRAIELGTRITIRDYNPFRVQRALKLFGAEEVTFECGSGVKVIKEKLVHRGGDCFCDNIETNLPYVKTVVPGAGSWCNEILMDEDNVVLRTGVIPARNVKFYYLHSL